MDINRIEPTLRPAGRNDGTQQWRSLLFCHWEISVDTLRAFVPTRLEIDTFAGKAYIGVVPFQMREIRPRWLPRRFAFNFLETNVRTYVVHNGRPGVYFFSLDASSQLAVWAARRVWSLPYYYATMENSEFDNQYSYRSHRKRQVAVHSVEFDIGNELGHSALGTLEHFLFERYLLYVEHRRRIYVGQVHHSPYQVYEASVKDIDDHLIGAVGLSAPNRMPDLAHYSPGVDVEVFGIKPATFTMN